MNWHKEIEILFVLKGNVQIKIRDNNYILSQDDIILINSYEMHEIAPLGEDIVILVFQLDPCYYQKYYPNFTEIIFHLNSTTVSKDINTYNTLKENLVIMMWYRLNEDKIYQIKLLKQSLALVELLIGHFVKTMIYDRNNNDRSQQRLISIIEYINKNYHKKLTLSEVAEKEYISIYYLSKFFKNKVGIGFNKYLNLFRLNKSMNDLLNSNKMILDIALDHGFPSVKAYTTLFKKTYKETPSSFRKKYLHNIPLTQKPTSVTKNSRNLLHNYIQLHAKDFLSQNLNEINHLSINMLQSNNTRISKETIVQYDFIYDGMNAYIQELLTKLTDDIPIDYIRFNGILNNNMNYTNNYHNMNYFYIDYLLDSILNIGIKPYIQLQYQEKNIAIKQWNFLTRSLINHCIKHYGLEKVMTWKFEFWFDEQSNNSSINQYNYILNNINECYNNINLGILFTNNNNNEIENIINRLNELNINAIDFITIDINDKYLCDNQQSIYTLINYLSINNIKLYFNINNYSNKLNETCYASSSFIYNSLNILRDVSTIVPLISKTNDGEIFNGIYSLLTYNGLKKPLYNAYYLLSLINGEVINEGDYYIIVKDNNRYYILLYYYSESLVNNISKIIYLNLRLSKGKYTVTTYILNDDNGCIYNEWLHMGSPKSLSKIEYNFLTCKECMRIKTSTIDTNDSIHLQRSIKGNEINLIEITKELSDNTVFNS
jgi:xylan 1,4-beta-xylosidase